MLSPTNLARLHIPTTTHHKLKSTAVVCRVWTTIYWHLTDNCPELSTADETSIGINMYQPFDLFLNRWHISYSLHALWLSTKVGSTYKTSVKSVEASSTHKLEMGLVVH